MIGNKSPGGESNEARVGIMPGSDLNAAIEKMVGLKLDEIIGDIIALIEDNSDNLTDEQKKSLRKILAEAEEVGKIMKHV